MFAELPMFTCFTHANANRNVNYIFFITPLLHDCSLMILVYVRSSSPSQYTWRLLGPLVVRVQVWDPESQTVWRQA